jgi:hypothetical protein
MLHVFDKGPTLRDGLERGTEKRHRLSPMRETLALKTICGLPDVSLQFELP